MLKEVVDVLAVGDDEPVPLLERSWARRVRDEPDGRRGGAGCWLLTAVVACGWSCRPVGQGVAVGSVVVERTVSDRSKVTVRLRGDLGVATGTDLRPVLIDMIMHEKPARIVIDVREATTVDPSVLGTLRAAHDLARDADLTLMFAAAGSQITPQLVYDGLPTSE